MNVKRSFHLTVVLVLLLYLDACGEENKKTLRVAASANMHIAMDSIAKVYEDYYNVKLEISTNSSGMLTNQILNGAPFDVFVSANLTYPNMLKDKGFTDEVDIYAVGRLVLVYKSQNSYNSIEEIIFANDIGKIGIANTKTAPYGIASLEYLENTKWLEKLNTKIVYGESISQVNQYIETKAVDAIFTSNSFVTKHGNDYKYIYINKNDYSPIKQGMCGLKKGMEANPNMLANFLNFMKSDTCKSILNHFGYD